MGSVKKEELIDGCTNLEHQFAIAAVECKSYSMAYNKVYDTTNSSVASANRMAWTVANRPHVKALIDLLRKELDDSLLMGVKEVLQQLIDIAMADPNDLVRQRNLNCRYCHGVGHQYRWRSQDEWAEACASVIEFNEGRTSKQKAKAIPSNAGGYGWRSNHPPHPDCTHCDGEGIQDTWIADTNKLTGRARKLYAGIERKANGGVKVLMRDQDAALANIGKALGMFVDTLKVTGGDVPLGVMTLPTDPQEASRVYQAMIKSNGL